MAKGRTKKKKEEKKRRFAFPEQKIGKCPACNRPVVWVSFDGHIIPCEPQRRLVVFAGPYDKNGIPEKPLVVYEEESGRLVIGREATEVERTDFREIGLPGLPYTIGYQGHWTVGCDRLDRFFTGEAKVPANLES